MLKSEKHGSFCRLHVLEMGLEIFNQNEICCFNSFILYINVYESADTELQSIAIQRVYTM